ncbi:MAG TPA: SGNH/GDSL hydrolase family protein [Planctomycetota bacterium]|nr:SGNH/GDSL hydrolase family protein [Planctomycetota bacterium]HRR80786.1 SGNH/GDSL hydrolase family protein [Planctomycetota bacterium]HRT94054.1 SGNH/GDSL hydrolase family protein [Planctomycetota bacterium]
MPLETPFATTPFAWYRVSFRAKAPAGAMIAAVSFGPDGQPLDADHHTGIDPSTEWTEQAFCTRGKAGGVHALIRANPPELANCVRDVAVQPVVRPAVAEWADAVWAAMPALAWQPPGDRWHGLANTAAALGAIGPRGQMGRTGQAWEAARAPQDGANRPIGSSRPFRVVMLGDSIVNDTGNSPWDVLVERRHPGLRLEVVTSVRGGTGCWHYRDAGRVKPYVLDHEPDLLMIGGISHNNDTEAIRSVIRQVREHLRPDILLMTGPFGKGRDPRMLRGWSPVVTPDGSDYRSRLLALARDEGCGFLDLEGAWGSYLLATDRPYEWFLRDPVHANTRGGMLLGRVLERFLA